MIENLQTRRLKPWLRAVAFVTALTVTITSTATASGSQSQSSPMPASSAARNAANPSQGILDSLHLPDTIGQVKKVFRGTRPEVVVHIQDAHVNEEAQKNIAKILDYFSKNHALRLVNLEGGHGELYTELFSFFPDAQVRKDVSEYFLKEGRLSGAEYQAVVEDNRLVLHGVEDPVLYQKNKEAYLDALNFKGKDEQVLGALDKTLKAVSRFVFSDELRGLARRREAFHESGQNLADYARYLIELAKANQIEISAFHGLQSLISILELEKAVNFEKAELEINDLGKDLKELLPREELTRYLTYSVQYRMKQMAKMSYYRYLETQILGISRTEKGASLNTKYAHLLKYLKYMQLYEAIDIEIFDEIDQLEENIKSKLFSSSEEIQLDKLIRVHSILEKMFDFSLMKQDADFFYAHREDFKSENFIKILEPMLTKHRFSEGLPKNLSSIDRDLPRIEKFYQAAIQRDHVLIDNAVKKMESSKNAVSAIITGGFHTPGIERYLAEHGYSYVVVTPKIAGALDTQAEAKRYEEAMSDKPMAIEQALAQAYLAPQSNKLNDPRFQLAIALTIIGKAMGAQGIGASPSAKAYWRMLAIAMAVKLRNPAQAVSDISKSFPSIPENEKEALSALVASVLGGHYLETMSGKDQSTLVQHIYIYMKQEAKYLVFEVSPAASGASEMAQTLGDKRMIASFNYGRYKVRIFSLDAAIVEAQLEKKKTQKLMGSAAKVTSLESFAAAFGSLKAADWEAQSELAAQVNLEAIKTEINASKNLLQLIKQAEKLYSLRQNARYGGLPELVSKVIDLIVQKTMAAANQRIAKAKGAKVSLSSPNRDIKKQLEPVRNALIRIHDVAASEMRNQVNEKISTTNALLAEDRSQLVEKQAAVPTPPVAKAVQKAAAKPIAAIIPSFSLVGRIKSVLMTLMEFWKLILLRFYSQSRSKVRTIGGAGVTRRDFLKATATGGAVLAVGSGAMAQGGAAVSGGAKLSVPNPLAPVRPRDFDVDFRKLKFPTGVSSTARPWVFQPSRRTGSVGTFSGAQNAISRPSLAGYKSKSDLIGGGTWIEAPHDQRPDNHFRKMEIEGQLKNFTGTIDRYVPEENRFDVRLHFPAIETERFAEGRKTKLYDPDPRTGKNARSFYRSVSDLGPKANDFMVHFDPELAHFFVLRLQAGELILRGDDAQAIGLSQINLPDSIDASQVIAEAVRIDAGARYLFVPSRDGKIYLLDFRRGEGFDYANPVIHKIPGEVSSVQHVNGIPKEYILRTGARMNIASIVKERLGIAAEKPEEESDYADVSITGLVKGEVSPGDLAYDKTNAIDRGLYTFFHPDANSRAASTMTRQELIDAMVNKLKADGIEVTAFAVGQVLDKAAQKVEEFKGIRSTKYEKEGQKEIPAELSPKEEERFQRFVVSWRQVLRTGEEAYYSYGGITRGAFDMTDSTAPKIDRETLPADFESVIPSGIVKRAQTIFLSNDIDLTENEVSYMLQTFGFRTGIFEGGEEVKRERIRQAFSGKITTKEEDHIVALLKESEKLARDYPQHSQYSSKQAYQKALDKYSSRYVQFRRSVVYQKLAAGDAEWANLLNVLNGPVRMQAFLTHFEYFVSRLNKDQKAGKFSYSHDNFAPLLGHDGNTKIRNKIQKEFQASQAKKGYRELGWEKFYGLAAYLSVAYFQHNINPEKRVVGTPDIDRFYESVIQGDTTYSGLQQTLAEIEAQLRLFEGPLHAAPSLSGVHPLAATLWGQRGLLNASPNAKLLDAVVGFNDSIAGMSAHLVKADQFARYTMMHWLYPSWIAWEDTSDYPYNWEITWTSVLKQQVVDSLIFLQFSYPALSEDAMIPGGEFSRDNFFKRTLADLSSLEMDLAVRKLLESHFTPHETKLTNAIRAGHQDLGESRNRHQTHSIDDLKAIGKGHFDPYLGQLISELEAKLDNADELRSPGYRARMGELILLYHLYQPDTPKTKKDEIKRRLGLYTKLKPWIKEYPHLKSFDEHGAFHAKLTPLWEKLLKDPEAQLMSDGEVRELISKRHPVFNEIDWKAANELMARDGGKRAELSWDRQLALIKQNILMASFEFALSEELLVRMNLYSALIENDIPVSDAQLFVDGMKIIDNDYVFFKYGINTYDPTDPDQMGAVFALTKSMYDQAKHAGEIYAKGLEAQGVSEPEIGVKRRGHERQQMRYLASLRKAELEMAIAKDGKGKRIQSKVEMEFQNFFRGLLRQPEHIVDYNDPVLGPDLEALFWGLMDRMVKDGISAEALAKVFENEASNDRFLHNRHREIFDAAKAYWKAYDEFLQIPGSAIDDNFFAMDDDGKGRVMAIIEDMAVEGAERTLLQNRKLTLYLQQLTAEDKANNNDPQKNLDWVLKSIEELIAARTLKPTPKIKAEDVIKNPKIAGEFVQFLSQEIATNPELDQKIKALNPLNQRSEVRTQAKRWTDMSRRDFNQTVLALGAGAGIFAMTNSASGAEGEMFRIDALIDSSNIALGPTNMNPSFAAPPAENVMAYAYQPGSIVIPSATSPIVPLGADTEDKSWFDQNIEALTDLTKRAELMRDVVYRRLALADPTKPVQKFASLEEENQTIQKMAKEVDARVKAGHPQTIGEVTSVMRTRFEGGWDATRGFAKRFFEVFHDQSKREEILDEAQLFADFQHGPGWVNIREVLSARGGDSKRKRVANGLVVSWGIFRLRQSVDLERSWKKTAAIAPEIVRVLGLVEASPEYAKMYFSNAEKLFALDRGLDPAAAKETSTLESFKGDEIRLNFVTGLTAAFVMDFNQETLEFDTKTPLEKKYAIHSRNLFYMLANSRNLLEEYYQGINRYNPEYPMDPQEKNSLRRTQIWGEYGARLRMIEETHSTYDLEESVIQEALRDLLRTQKAAAQHWKSMEDTENVYYYRLFYLGRRDGEILVDKNSIFGKLKNSLSVEDFFKLIHHVQIVEKQAGEDRVKTMKGWLENPADESRWKWMSDEELQEAIDLITGHADKKYEGIKNRRVLDGEAVTLVIQFMMRQGTIPEKMRANLSAAKDEFWNRSRYEAQLQSQYMLYHRGDDGKPEPLPRGQMAPYLNQIAFHSRTLETVSKIFKYDGLIAHRFQSQLAARTKVYIEGLLERSLTSEEMKALEEIPHMNEEDIVGMAAYIQERQDLRTEALPTIGNTVEAVEDYLEHWLDDAAFVQAESFVASETGFFLPVEILQSAIDIFREGQDYLDLSKRHVVSGRFKTIFKVVDPSYRDLRSEKLNQIRQLRISYYVVFKKSLPVAEEAWWIEQWQKLSEGLRAKGIDSTQAREKVLKSFLTRMATVRNQLTEMFHNRLFAIGKLTDEKAESVEEQIKIFQDFATDKIIANILRMPARAKLVKERRARILTEEAVLMRYEKELQERRDEQKKANRIYLTSLSKRTELKNLLRGKSSVTVDEALLENVINMMIELGYNADEVLFRQIELPRVAYPAIYRELTGNDPDLEKSIGRISAAMDPIFKRWGYLGDGNADLRDKITADLSQVTETTATDVWSGIKEEIQEIKARMELAFHLQSELQKMGGKYQYARERESLANRIAADARAGGLTKADLSDWIATVLELSRRAEAVNVSVSDQELLFRADSIFRLGVADLYQEPEYDSRRDQSTRVTVNQHMKAIYDSAAAKADHTFADPVIRGRNLEIILGNQLASNAGRKKEISNQIIERMIGQKMLPVDFKILMDRARGVKEMIDQAREDYDARPVFSEAVGPMPELSLLEIMLYLDATQADPLKKIGLFQIIYPDISGDDIFRFERKIGQALNEKFRQDQLARFKDEIKKPDYAWGVGWLVEWLNVEENGFKNIVNGAFIWGAGWWVYRLVSRNFFADPLSTRNPETGKPLVAGDKLKDWSPNQLYRFNDSVFESLLDTYTMFLILWNFSIFFPFAGVFSVVWATIFLGLSYYLLRMNPFLTLSQVVTFRKAVTLATIWTVGILGLLYGPGAVAASIMAILTNIPAVGLFAGIVILLMITSSNWFKTLPWVKKHIGTSRKETDEAARKKIYDEVKASGLFDRDPTIPVSQLPAAQQKPTNLMHLADDEVMVELRPWLPGGDTKQDFIDKLDEVIKNMTYSMRGNNDKKFRAILLLNGGMFNDPKASADLNKKLPVFSAGRPTEWTMTYGEMYELIQERIKEVWSEFDYTDETGVKHYGYERVHILVMPGGRKPFLQERFVRYSRWGEDGSPGKWWGQIEYEYRTKLWHDAVAEGKNPPEGAWDPSAEALQPKSYEVNGNTFWWGIPHLAVKAAQDAGGEAARQFYLVPPFMIRPFFNGVIGHEEASYIPWDTAKSFDFFKAYLPREANNVRVRTKITIDDTNAPFPGAAPFMNNMIMHYDPLVGDHHYPRGENDPVHNLFQGATGYHMDGVPAWMPTTLYEHQGITAHLSLWNTQQEKGEILDFIRLFGKYSGTTYAFDDLFAPRPGFPLGLYATRLWLLSGLLNLRLEELNEEGNTVINKQADVNGKFTGIIFNGPNSEDEIVSYTAFDAIAIWTWVKKQGKNLDAFKHASEEEKGSMIKEFMKLAGQETQWHLFGGPMAHKSYDQMFELLKQIQNTATPPIRELGPILVERPDQLPLIRDDRPKGKNFNDWREDYKWETFDIVSFWTEHSAKVVGQSDRAQRLTALVTFGLASAYVFPLLLVMGAAFVGHYFGFLEVLYVTGAWWLTVVVLVGLIHPKATGFIFRNIQNLPVLEVTLTKKITLEGGTGATLGIISGAALGLLALLSPAGLAWPIIAAIAAALAVLGGMIGVIPAGNKTTDFIKSAFFAPLSAVITVLIRVPLGIAELAGSNPSFLPNVVTKPRTLTKNSVNWFRFWVFGGAGTAWATNPVEAATDPIWVLFRLLAGPLAFTASFGVIFIASATLGVPFWILGPLALIAATYLGYIVFSSQEFEDVIGGAKAAYVEFKAANLKKTAELLKKDGEAGKAALIEKQVQELENEAKALAFRILGYRISGQAELAGELTDEQRTDLFRLAEYFVQTADEKSKGALKTPFWEIFWEALKWYIPVNGTAIAWYFGIGAAATALWIFGFHLTAILFAPIALQAFIWSHHEWNDFANRVFGKKIAPNMDRKNREWAYSRLVRYAIFSLMPLALLAASGFLGGIAAPFIPLHWIVLASPILIAIFTAPFAGWFLGLHFKGKWQKWLPWVDWGLGVSVIVLFFVALHPAFQPFMGPYLEQMAKVPLPVASTTIGVEGATGPYAVLLNVKSSLVYVHLLILAGEVLLFLAGLIGSVVHTVLILRSQLQVSALKEKLKNFNLPPERRGAIEKEIEELRVEEFSWFDSKTTRWAFGYLGAFLLVIAGILGFQNPRKITEERSASPIVIVDDAPYSFGASKAELKTDKIEPVAPAPATDAPARSEVRLADALASKEEMLLQTVGKSRMSEMLAEANRLGPKLDKVLYSQEMQIMKALGITPGTVLGGGNILINYQGSEIHTDIYLQRMIDRQAKLQNNGQRGKVVIFAQDIAQQVTLSRVLHGNVQVKLMAEFNEDAQTNAVQIMPDHRPTRAEELARMQNIEAQAAVALSQRNDVLLGWDKQLPGIQQHILFSELLSVIITAARAKARIAKSA